MPTRLHIPFFLLFILSLLAGCEPAVQPSVAAAVPTQEAVVSSQAPDSPTPAIPATTTPTLPPTFTPSPEPSAAAEGVCRGETGQMLEKQLSSALLPKPLVFRVYLPPCYTRETQLRYGVLYLLHGLQSGADQWQRLGIGSTADRMILGGEIPPLIVVLPQDESSNQPDGDPFGEALVDELIPWVDSHYRTQASRPYRAIGGLSRGAGWAVHIGFTRPDAFGAVGAHSLPLFWSDAGQLPSLLGQIPSAQMPRVYLDIGINDHEVQGAADFETLLTANNIPHEWHLNQGYHNEEYWTAHLEQYLRFYTAGWEK